MKGRDNYEYMTAGSVPRTICELAVPTIISMLVTAIYNVADTYFVGRIDTQSTAAIGISFSAMSVVQAFGFFFGHGSGNYISRMLGARKTGHAETMATIGLFSSFAAGTVIAITGIIFLGPLCMALGSTETILPYAKEYLGIILIGTPFMAASLTLNNQIRFKGNAKYAMVGIISGAFINIILDPILIFGFDMGVRGAAIATISGQIIGFAALLFIDRRTGTFSVSFRAFKPTVRAYIEIIKGGLPSLLGSQRVWRQRHCRNGDNHKDNIHSECHSNRIGTGLPACLRLQLRGKTLRQGLRGILVLRKGRNTLFPYMLRSWIYIRT